MAETDSLIERYFSADEVAKLEADLPRLRDVSRKLLVPFVARALRDARVVWLNKRWWLARGIDVFDPSVERRVTDWLLADFAFVVPRAEDPADAFVGAPRRLYADRYGSAGSATMHGGSGRVATVGCFQAKGVGVTPLVGASAPAGHAHGCFSLTEAVREAIYAEVSDLEFPHGGVPVIAIIDTGLFFSSPDTSERYDQNVRRAIVVRPAVLRPAHAERAPLFKRSITGFVNVQADDVARTREAIAFWAPSNVTTTSAMSVLRRFVQNLAEQVAFGQAQRLCNGGIFSSNLSVSGALLDFGNMHALPDWRRAKVLDHTAAFGQELQAAQKIVRSVAFFFRKYHVDAASVDATALSGLLVHAHEHAFAREMARIVGLDTSASEGNAGRAATLLTDYYRQQQKCLRNYKHGEIVAAISSGSSDEWLYDALFETDFSVLPISSAAEHVLKSVDAILRERASAKTEESRALAWMTAARYLQPREMIDRGRLLRNIHTILSGPTAPSAAVVDDLIRNVIGSGLRHWPRLPNCFGVMAQTYADGSSALLCRKFPSDRPILWLQGIRCGVRYRLFDMWATAGDLHGVEIQSDGTAWTTSVAVNNERHDAAQMLRIGACTVSVPPMQHHYPTPHSRWVRSA